MCNWGIRRCRIARTDSKLIALVAIISNDFPYFRFFFPCERIIIHNLTRMEIVNRVILQIWNKLLNSSVFAYMLFLFLLSFRCEKFQFIYPSIHSFIWILDGDTVIDRPVSGIFSLCQSYLVDVLNWINVKIEFQCVLTTCCFTLVNLITKSDRHHTGSDDIP